MEHLQQAVVKSQGNAKGNVSLIFLGILHPFSPKILLLLLLLLFSRLILTVAFNPIKSAHLLLHN